MKKEKEQKKAIRPVLANMNRGASEEWPVSRYEVVKATAYNCSRVWGKRFSVSLSKKDNNEEQTVRVTRIY